MAYSDGPIDIKKFVETGEMIPIEPTPLTQEFVAGLGRPDLEMLYRTLEMLDSPRYTVHEARESLVLYLNRRT